MPDHLHFFCAPGGSGDPASLSRFVGRFKQWSAKEILHVTKLSAPLWQREFFDHVLRYDVKQQYVMENPVRAGLVQRPEDWNYRGEIAPLLR